MARLRHRGGDLFGACRAKVAQTLQAIVAQLQELSNSAASSQHHLLDSAGTYEAASAHDSREILVNM